jgi:3-oxoacyl-[acyl-carrier-protein] synthase II
MNATKSLIGHCLGAAAGIEAVAVVKAIQTGWLHPTLNQHNLVDEVRPPPAAAAGSGPRAPRARCRRRFLKEQAPPKESGPDRLASTLRTPSPQVAGIDTVPNEKKQLDVTAACSNSFGFGGHNSAVIFAPYKA